MKKHGLNVRFQAPETEGGLSALDKAIEVLGYRTRAEWYRDMKRQTLELAKMKFDEQKEP